MYVSFYRNRLAIIKALRDVIDNGTNDVTITHITHVTYHLFMTWVYDIGKQVDYVMNTFMKHY